MRKAESLNVMIDLRSTPPSTTLQVVSAAKRAGVRKLIWPLATTAMLIALVGAVVIEFRLPPEQRAALFVVQSQIYP
jgi:hypothetical protein